MEKKRAGRPKSRPIDPVIGQRVKEARNLKGMTQYELAEKIGVSKDTIRNWEKGRSRPDNDDIYVRIAEVLNVTSDWIKNQSIPDIIQKSRDILHNFNPSEWELIEFPSLKEEARSYALIYSLEMCGYSLDDVKNRKMYAEYMEETIKNAIDVYMKTLNR
ncbi:MAG: helix-turn-helix domain-containing protein [Butyrivibrio sp.]